MRLDGAVALVSGAGRGVGAAFVRNLRLAGAAKIYAAVRDPDSVDTSDPRVEVVALDITDPMAVARAASICTDTTLLVNNAGVMSLSPPVGATDLTAARWEMETNYFGTLSMCRAFAPILAANGGGAVVNVLSVVSWYALPFNATYCASKSAEWALTNALRVELRAQGTRVVGVHAGFVDTDMAADVSTPKISPQEVVERTLDSVVRDEEEVFVDEWSRHVHDTLPTHLTTLYPEVQRLWDAGESPWNSASG